MMCFSHALLRIKEGKRLCRSGWNGKDQWVEIQRPDENSKMTEPYIYIKNQQGGIVPWLASQGDMMAEDWEVI